jgi:hypothetical protein
MVFFSLYFPVKEACIRRAILAISARIRVTSQHVPWAIGVSYGVSIGNILRSLGTAFFA